MRNSIGWTLAAGALLSLAAPAALVGQLAPSAGGATFYVLVRGDTIAIEHVTRTAEQLDGELFIRPNDLRIRYTALLAANGLVDRITVNAFRPAADTVPLQGADAQFTGDSLHVVVHARAGDSKRTLPIPANALPFINLSPGIVEQIARRARPLGDSVVVPLVDPARGASFPGTVRWVTRDSASFTINNVVTAIALDSAGQLRTFAVPSQALRTIRVAGERPLGYVRADYSAPAGAPYDAIPVHVKTPAGLTLGGTLTLPHGASAHPVAAVVTITGSGPEDRDEAIPAISPNYRPFRDVADTLGRRGIAVLRLDDRGVGESEPGAPDPTSEDFAGDVEAALAYLRTRADIDPNRLGLVGHSEGGAIAPMVAARDTGVRAIVLLAGPGKGGKEISMDQARYAVEHQPGLTPAQRDSLLARQRVALDSIARTPGWSGFWMRHDPIATARQVKRAHVLILQGATDRQVTAEQAELLARAFRTGGNRDVTVRVFPATNHLFVTDSTGDFSTYRKLPDFHVRRDVLGVMSDWLVREMGAASAVPVRK